MNKYKVKIIITAISILLLNMVILFYFIDNSMSWNISKISSCIFVSLWISFIPQMITYYLFKIKNSGLGYSVSLGYEIGIRGFIGLLFAPYYGIKFYFVDLKKLKYDGEFFL
ncbi:hypothetical protein [Acholeplasma palmae]|nr:hypothetical protein [Alteracholeplasma palmae]